MADVEKFSAWFVERWYDEHEGWLDKPYRVEMDGQILPGKSLVKFTSIRAEIEAWKKEEGKKYEQTED